MKKTIVLDFDGVIHSYDRGWYDGTIYGHPIPGAKEVLWDLIHEGYDVVIHTSRPNWEEIPKWMEDNGLPLLEIIPGKPKGILYIDDRAVRFTNWKDVKNYLI